MVADLGVVNVILGMAFLKAYGAIIALMAEQVWDRQRCARNITCSDSTSVCLKQACVVAQVEDCEVPSNFLFEPTISLSYENCFLAVQIAIVRSGLCDLNVEYRGLAQLLSRLQAKK